MLAQRGALNQMDIKEKFSQFAASMLSFFVSVITTLKKLNGRG